MAESTVFQKGIQPKGWNEDFTGLENSRSKRDEVIARELGIELDRRPGSYLERWIRDWNIVPNEYRAKKAAVWDFETTDRWNAYAVSMAIQVVDLETGEIDEEFYTLINPDGEEIEKEAQKVHGISMEDVAEAPTFKEVWPKIEEMFKRVDMFIGQNLGFDIAVLDRELDRMGVVNPWTSFPLFDTMMAAKELLSIKAKGSRKLKNPNLEEIADYFGIEVGDEGYHNALEDVKVTTQVALGLMGVKIEEDEEFEKELDLLFS